MVKGIMNIFIIWLILYKCVNSIKTSNSNFSSAFINSGNSNPIFSKNINPSMRKYSKTKYLEVNSMNSLNEYERIPYQYNNPSHLEQNNFKLKGIKLENNVVPLNDYVLILKSDFSQVTKSGVYVGSQEKEFIGRVLAVGPGKLNKTTGVVIPPSLVVGDTVVFDNPEETVDLKYNNKKCVLVKEERIFARIELPKDGLDNTVSYDRIVPLSDRLLVRVLESPRKTESGLVLSRSEQKEELTKGKVVSLGPGIYDDNGKLLPITDLKVGDVILYSENGYDRGEFTADNVNYEFVRKEAVLAKL